MAYSRAMDGPGPGALLRIRHRLFDRLVYLKLRDAMGGKVVYAVSGGAPLGVELAHFFRGIGINILEGWGLTETTAGVTMNLPAAQRIGSTGRPLTGCAVRIAPDGVVLARGPTVCCGYWHNAAAASKAFEDDWFRTGDLGRLDSEGFPLHHRPQEGPHRHGVRQECGARSARRPAAGPGSSRNASSSATSGPMSACW